MVHILLKPGLENFEHYLTSMWDECNCVVVWAFFGIAFLWDWNENCPFPVLWPLLSFPNLLAYWVQHFHSMIFQNLNFFFFPKPLIKQPVFPMGVTVLSYIFEHLYVYICLSIRKSEKFWVLIQKYRTVWLIPLWFIYNPHVTSKTT